MKTRTGVVLSLLVLAAGGGAYGYFVTAKQDASRKPAAPAVPVALIQAARGDVPLRLDVVGRAEAYEAVTLRARLDGQVAKVVFTEGQHVKPGDVLLHLDPADYEARLRQAEAALARDQAQLTKARRDVERYQALRAKGFVSEEKVGEVKTAAEAQESTVKAAQASVDLARLQLGYTTVRAPIAGVVGARLVAPGAAVKINDTVLAVINRRQPLYVSFAVPEKHLPRLRAGIRGGNLKVAVTVPGGAGPVHEGTARFLDNAVDTATGTIQLKAVLPNADEALTPGQFLNVGIVLDTLHDVVTIPAEALQQGQDGSFVFVVTAEGVAQPRPVEVAAVQSGTAAIAKGLAAGETVVTDGQLRLAAGTRVQSKDAGKAVAAPPNN
ncbi:MAG: efflux RND transporter periplasmic adaptor subunit [Rhodocyclales bacterium]|nr:efflux RND transporter periplasmic adaptor subunit [Rhodocyclales bacterium]